VFTRRDGTIRHSGPAKWDLRPLTPVRIRVVRLISIRSGPFSTPRRKAAARLVSEPELLNVASLRWNPRMTTGRIAQEFHAFLPPHIRRAFNPHLTKTRLNDAPRLCEMLRPELIRRGTEEGLVELFWTQGE